MSLSKLLLIGYVSQKSAPVPARLLSYVCDMDCLETEISEKDSNQVQVNRVNFCPCSRVVWCLPSVLLTKYVFLSCERCCSWWPAPVENQGLSARHSVVFSINQNKGLNG